MLGTNDCKTVYSISADIIGKEIEKLLDHVEAGNAHTKILLVSPIHPGDDIWKDGFVKEFQQQIRNSIQTTRKCIQKIAFNRRISNLGASDIASPDYAE